MNIANNILKDHLKNVYFISGTACGGKSTISKLLSQKYGFILYDQDKQYDRHRLIANKIDQPAMCYPRRNKEEFLNFFTRPKEEYAKWVRDSSYEDSQMVLIDLIKLSEKGTVIADVLVEPVNITDIVETNHVVFLTCDVALIKQSYFNRPDKKEFYNYVSTFEQSQEIFENIFSTLQLENFAIKQAIQESPFYSINRTMDSTIEKTLLLVEKHFNFTK